MKLLTALLLISVIFPSGCSVQTAGRVAAKTISTAGSVAAKTTVAVVKTSGHVAASTTKTVVQTGGSVATSMGKMAFVTFKDTTTGVSKQIPYREGMRLYTASQTAKFDAGLKAFKLLRNGTPVMTAKWSSVKPGTYNDPELSPGDVVQF